MDYKTSGVNIDAANSTKEVFKSILDSNDERVLNKVGAFASLFSMSSIKMEDPVLVMKTEEPGSKQLLAFEHDWYESICFDMINHLVNDCIMMGARPLIVQDCIVCGEMQRDKIERMVKAMADACRLNSCTLVGGETSEQPGVIPAGTFILSSSIVGVVERKAIIDGRKIKEGDDIIALSSSGPHTNGYTLIRAILKKHPELVDNKKFMYDILAVHRPYYPTIKDLFPVIKGMAHITGGGIKENLNRILPSGMSALVDLSKLEILKVFKKIKEYGEVPDADMLRTFNLGVGVTMVLPPEISDDVVQLLSNFYSTYKIGKIVTGNKTVEIEGSLNW